MPLKRRRKASPPALDEPSDKAMRSDLAELHQEMQVLGNYGTTESGNRRKKLTRDQSAVRTQKWRQLERQERLKQLEVQRTDKEPRRRGPKAAAHDDIIQGSLVFQARIPRSRKNGENEEFNEEVVEDEDYEGSDDISDGDGHQEDVEYDNEPKKAASTTTTQRKRRRNYRNRNFRSIRMAERHGEALAAHARGQHREAIEKLKEIARDAPSAPQVYQSLGMVYEDMLRNLKQSTVGTDLEGDESAKTLSHLDMEQQNVVANDDRGQVVERIPDAVLAEQLELAKKAYGAHHVAAILCKRDFKFWDKAASLAIEIADFHREVVQLPHLSDELDDLHRSERQRWLNEAKNDLQTADNLKPPGIDIPAKLASVLMDLGHLSEALTLLTDLKNRKQFNGRSEFETSYRAWWLYADLMLRIGYECNKWNDGVYSNNNYMFRRWLRKLSTSFDWKERRLQALVKALEAAAGSQSCRQLMEWLKKRALDPTAYAAAPIAPAAEMEQQSDFLEREKALLLKRNQAEIDAFDKTTKEMLMNPDEEPYKAREVARRELVERQELSVSEMIGEFDESGETQASEAANSLSVDDEADNDGPISASLKSVHAIASELFRHLLDMKLYDGGRLVGEAVSAYLKERAAAYVSKADDKVRSASVRPRLFGTQDEHFLQDNSEDSDLVLSDEEDLTQSIASMHAGALPPELMVLYGLCLIGSGGKHFLGSKCLNALKSLEQESRQWLNESYSDIDSDKDWEVFQRNLTRPLGRTASFAYVADFLQRTGKDRDVAPYILPLFASQVEIFKSIGLEVDAFGVADDCDEGNRMLTFSLERAKMILHVEQAFAKLQLYYAEQLLSSNQTAKALGLLKSSATILSDILSSVWKLKPDGSIPGDLVSVMESFALICHLMWSVNGLEDVALLLDLINLLRKPVSTVCARFDLAHLGSVAEVAIIPDLTTLPISSSWLLEHRKGLATRAFNLCVSTNVSFFSGWETQEFSVGLLHRRDAPNHFGISTTNGLVSGTLSPSNEKELTRQWEIIKNDLGISAFDFESKLRDLQFSSWYTESKTKHCKAIQDSRVAAYGEEEGLSILLSFSRACLLRAKETTPCIAKDALILDALSVVLPCSQFCLNCRLWDSTIGGFSDSHNENPLVRWQSLLIEEKKDESLPPSKLPGYVRASARRTSMSNVVPPEIARSEWLNIENKTTPLANIIEIPCATLLTEWRKAEVENKSFGADQQHAIKAMTSVSYALKSLRECYSETAVERASLKVAVALLDLAACTECLNPFHCLQNAALFASQATKRGISDLALKGALPEKLKCTPLEALVILGRADCLANVYFCPEAAFLCSYVSSVCSVHRRNAEAGWNDQWKIVSIVAYNVSVIIRYTSSCVLKERNDEIKSVWGRDVTDELKLGRSDGLKLRARLGLEEPSERKLQTISPMSTAHENATPDQFPTHHAVDTIDEVVAV